MRCLLLLLLAFPAQAQQIQWVHSKLVQPYTQESLEGPNPFTWRSATFPYTVPKGMCLNLYDAQLSSKFGGEGRASYFVITNVLTVPDNNGSVHFRVPIIVPAGATINGYLINNDVEQQWMGSVLTGYLTPEPCGVR